MADLDPSNEPPPEAWIEDLNSQVQGLLQENEGLRESLRVATEPSQARLTWANWAEARITALEAEVERLRAELDAAWRAVAEERKAGNNAIERLRAERAWRDISSAPRDKGDPVLTWEPGPYSGHGGFYRVARWWGGGRWIEANTARHIEPTHYAALPPPPERGA